MRYLSDCAVDDTSIISLLPFLQEKFWKIFSVNKRDFSQRLTVEKEIYGDWDRTPDFMLSSNLEPRWI